MTALRRALACLGVVDPPAPAAGDDRRLGRAGERAAARALRRAGFRILGRNVRVKFGEADLVALDPDGRTIVVVEVKTRRIPSALLPGERRPTPAPELNVHSDKQRRLLAIARYLARANGWVGRPIRIDVVAIDWPARGRPQVRHRRNAVSRR
jgi:putative endonuclease